MRSSLALMLVFTLLCVTTGRGENILPPRSNFVRYAAMVNHSPFAIATAALPAATPDFAKDLYVANAAHFPGGDMITLASSSDHNFKKYLTTGQDVDGFTISSVEWSERVGATKVTISKDGNFATLTFNEALLSQRLALNAPPILDQVLPSMPPPQSVPSMQALDPPKVSRRRVIQQKPEATPTPNPTPISPQLPDPPSFKSSEQRQQEKSERRHQLKADSLRPVAPTQPNESGDILPELVLPAP